MVSKYKKANIKNILLGAIIVVLLGGIGIALNTSKLQEERPVATAEEFVKNIYTVDEKKAAEFKIIYELTPPGMGIIGEGITEGTTTPPNEEYTKIHQSLYANIQPLMTIGGYQAIVANRLDNLSLRICRNGNYTAQVTDITLGEDVYKEYKDNDKVRYPYEVKFNFISSDSKTKEAVTAKGSIELIKEDGKWKVGLYDITQFPQNYMDRRDN
jgi:hypothetical protein